MVRANCVHALEDAHDLGSIHGQGDPGWVPGVCLVEPAAGAPPEAKPPEAKIFGRFGGSYKPFIRIYNHIYTTVRILN